MKKFVSMETINKAFNDLDLIDYVTVSNVTDSMIELYVYLNSFKVPDPGSKEFMEFKDRCIVLGKMLDRKVYFIPVPAKFSSALKTRLMSYLKQLT